MYLSSQELQIGQFVKSKAGRDKGHVMIVVGKADEFHVLVADGDLRKLEKPKKKKVKHLIKHGELDVELQTALMDGKSILNAWLKKKIHDKPTSSQ